MRENTVVYLHALEPTAQLVGGREPGEPRFRADMTVFGGALDKERKERLAADVHAAICAAAGMTVRPPRLSRVDVDSRNTRRQLGGRRQNHLLPTGEGTRR